MKKYLLTALFALIASYCTQAQTLKTTLSLNTGISGDLSWNAAVLPESALNKTVGFTNIYSIEKHPFWSSLPNSQWVHTNKTYDNNLNGQYVYESSFSLEKESKIDIDFLALADDDVEVKVDGKVILPRQWHAYQNPVAVKHQDLFAQGKHTITFTVWNSQSVASGLCVSGKVTNLTPANADGSSLTSN